MYYSDFEACIWKDKIKKYNQRIQDMKISHNYLRA